jgi:hypothetical protein
MGQHAQYRNLVGALGAAALLAAGPAPAQVPECRLALAFALDVSASVDPGEYRQQLDGLAEALADPAVRAAILGPGGNVVMAAYEWSGRNQQVMIAGWSAIDSEEALDAFSRAVVTHKRQYGEFPTAIGYALGYGAVLLRGAPACQRKVLDVSGDGLTNDGFGPVEAYRHFDFGGVTVNGLVVGGGDLELISYYQHVLIHGQGAFTEVALDYADYARAMRRKLLREIGADFVAGG